MLYILDRLLDEIPCTGLIKFGVFLLIAIEESQALISMF